MVTPFEKPVLFELSVMEGILGAPIQPLLQGEYQAKLGARA